MSRTFAWGVWTALLVPYLYMAAVVMPGLLSGMQEVAEDASCARPLDLFLFGFSQDDVLQTLGCLGTTGRAVYREGELTADVAYPIAYGLLLSCTLWFLSGGVLQDRWRYMLAAIPLLAMLVDYVENAHIVMLIDQFPAVLEQTVNRGSAANAMKWGLAFLSIASVLGLSVQHARRLFGRGSQ
jgi:hypothetical protein